MELTAHQSSEIANTILIANSFLFQIDVEYLATVQKILQSEADRYDTMAVLNRKWTPHGSDLKKKEARALQLLIDYIQCNKDIDAIRAKHDSELSTQELFAV